MRRNIRILLAGVLVGLLFSGLSIMAGDRPEGNPLSRILTPGIPNHAEILISHQKPDNYTPRVAPVRTLAPFPADGVVCVFKDVDAWGFPAEESILGSNSIPYEVHSSAEFATLRFDDYGMIIICGDQTQGFYDAYASYVAKFADYVSQGRFLLFIAADAGWNGGYLDAPLPGGMIVNPCYSAYNYIEDPLDPVVQGIENPFSGSSASHGYFTSLPQGARVIAYAENCNDVKAPRQVEFPTIVAYQIGCGWVYAFTQPMEYGWYYGQASGDILMNAIPYGYSSSFSCYDLIYVDDLGRSRLCVNSQTGAYIYKVLSGIGQGEYSGQAYLSMRNGVLFINSTTLNPRLQFYDNQKFHRAYGSFTKGTLRSYLDDKNTANNPAACQ